MHNKILLWVIVILIPLVVISFFNKKTNFILSQNNHEEQIKILLKIDDKQYNLLLDDYLIGVVSAEMPALFHEEALKTQAVVARTFALYQMNHRGFVTTGDQAFISETQMREKWLDNYDTMYNRIKKAVFDTKNEVIYYDDEIIKSYYYAISSGYTEEPAAVFQENYDYLKIVSSPDMNVNKYKSEYTFSEKQIQNILGTEERIYLNEINIKDNNYVDNIVINNKKFSGVEFRKLFNLRSAAFLVNYENDILHITCYGYGHGVGLSQYGANEMAKGGISYQDIIKHYYQDIKIKDFLHN